MTTASKPAPPRPAGPGPKPAGPTRPTPTGPPPRDLADGTGGPWPSAPGPSNPGGPTGPGRLATDLDHAELLLRALQLLEADLAGADPGWRMRLAYGLRTARNAVSALKTPARQPLDSAAAVGGGPVQSSTPTALTTAGSEAARPRAAVRAGGPPAPGADRDLAERLEETRERAGDAMWSWSDGQDFSLPPIPTVPSFDNGRCAQGWPPPSVPWPGRPFPVYEVPAP